MTLSQEMADYEAPPAMPDQQPNKKDTIARLKERVAQYRSRHFEMVETGMEAIRSQFAASEEQTKICYEKWQQAKAKKTNKRQRDPNNQQTNQLKRKLPVGKTDGPQVKQAHRDKAGVELEVTDGEELKDLFLDGLELPDNFTENNLNDIMTMLEESENSNGSQGDSTEDSPKKEQRRTAPSYSQQHTLKTPHLNTTPHSQAPSLHAQQQQQQQQQHHAQVYASQGSSGPQAMLLQPYNVKTERVVPSALYTRSMSETTGRGLPMAQHIAQPQRVNSMPLDYPLPGYSSSCSGFTSSKQISNTHMGASPCASAAPVHPDYTRQMSAPADGYYHSAPLSNGHYSASTGPLTSAYPQYPSSYHQQQRTIQEMHAEQARLSYAQKLARANSQPTADPFIDQRQPGAYYRATHQAEGPLLHQHSASVHHIHSQPAHPDASLGHVGYMSSRNQYMQHITQQAQHNPSNVTIMDATSRPMNPHSMSHLNPSKEIGLTNNTTNGFHHFPTGTAAGVAATHQLPLVKQMSQGHSLYPPVLPVQRQMPLHSLPNASAMAQMTSHPQQHPQISNHTQLPAQHIHMHSQHPQVAPQHQQVTAQHQQLTAQHVQLTAHQQPMTAQHQQLSSHAHQSLPIGQSGHLPSQQHTLSNQQAMHSHIMHRGPHGNLPGHMLPGPQQHHNAAQAVPGNQVHYSACQHSTTPSQRATDHVQSRDSQPFIGSSAEDLSDLELILSGTQ